MLYDFIFAFMELFEIKITLRTLIELVSFDDDM
jgi:hypothetical protein